MKASDVIRLLRLQKLEPEGGFFRQCYKARDEVHVPFGPNQEIVKRSNLTSIYYLLTASSFSAFHRLKSDEVYHYYMGGRVELNLIYPSGSLRTIILGSELEQGDLLQFTVEKNVWQGSRVVSSSEFDWALVGTTVAPGFEFDDFILADREELKSQFKSHSSIIDALTRSK